MVAKVRRVDRCCGYRGHVVEYIFTFTGEICEVCEAVIGDLLAGGGDMGGAGGWGGLGRGGNGPGYGEAADIEKNMIVNMK